MADQRQSGVYNIVSQAIVSSVFKDIISDVNYIVAKARQLCYCNDARKEAVISSIYSKCEHDISLKSADHLRDILQRLRIYSTHVYDKTEFWRLHDSLVRFTHCNSFFDVCTPMIIATLATLITLVLVNQLLYAAEMIEYIETYLFETAKPLSQDLADLLDMKYGLINLLQYKILPLIVGYDDHRAGTSTVITDYSAEVNKLLTLPVRSTMVDDVYQHLLNNGISTANNYAEYVAGLKITELDTQDKKGQLPQPTKYATALPVNVPAMIRDPLKKLAAAVTTDDEKLLTNAHRYATGHVLDGAVSSPIKEETHFIPLSMADINKFMILDYLYTMRVLANCVKRKNSCKKKSAGVTLSINSPFKIITVPGK